MAIPNIQFRAQGLPLPDQRAFDLGVPHNPSPTSPSLPPRSREAESDADQRARFNDAFNTAMANLAAATAAAAEPE